MERRPFSFGDASLVAWMAASVATCAIALRIWPLLVFLPAMAASCVLRPKQTPRRFGIALRWGGGILTALLMAVVLLVTFQGMAVEQALRLAVPGTIALALALTIGLFDAGASTRVTTIAASIALLSAAGLRREAPYLVAGYLSSAILALVHAAGARHVRPFALGGFVLVAAGVTALLAQFLPWAQPWVEQKAGDLLVSGGTGRAGLSLTSRLGDLEELALSPEITMRVWTSEPQYLRARVYTRFDGRSWYLSNPNARRPLLRSDAVDPPAEAWLREVPGVTFAVPSASAGPSTVRTRVLQSSTALRVLPSPRGVAVARLGESGGWVDDAGVLLPGEEAPPMTAFLNRRGDQPAAVVPEECLDVSTVQDPRLRALAERLGTDADAAERIRRTLVHLERTCTYSLQVGAFRSADPVAEFVFDKRRGYCEYFATAAALLLRMQGVPSRYVVGYSVRPSNLEGDHYVVRASDAHAWVEAFLPGRGWIELDPTPASQFEAMRAAIRGGTLSLGWEKVRCWWAETLALIRQAGALAVLRRGALPILTILLGAASIVWGKRRGARLLREFLSRRRREKGTAPVDGPGVPAELLDLLRQLDAIWRRSGHPRPASRAPLEHLRGLPPAAQVGGDLVELLYRCRYGGVAPSSESLAGIRRSLGAAAR